MSVWSIDRHNGEMPQPYINIEQLAGQQTTVGNQLFDTYFRVMEIGQGKYKIHDFSSRISNIYYSLMLKKGLNIREAYKKIQKEIEEREWNADDMKTFMSIGLFRGLKVVLANESNRENKEGLKHDDFRTNKTLDTLCEIETIEDSLGITKVPSSSTEDKLKTLEWAISENEETDPASARMLVYEKYKLVYKQEQQRRQNRENERSIGDIRQATDVHNNTDKGNRVEL